MPFCIACGNKTADDDKFCLECGAPQVSATNTSTTETFPAPAPLPNLTQAKTDAEPTKVAADFTTVSPAGKPRKSRKKLILSGIALLILLALGIGTYAYIDYNENRWESDDFTTYWLNKTGIKKRYVLFTTVEEQTTPPDTTSAPPSTPLSSPVSAPVSTPVVVTPPKYTINDYGDVTAANGTQYLLVDLARKLYYNTTDSKLYDVATGGMKLSAVTDTLAYCPPPHRIMVVLPATWASYKVVPSQTLPEGYNSTFSSYEFMLPTTDPVYTATGGLATVFVITEVTPEDYAILNQNYYATDAFMTLGRQAKYSYIATPSFELPEDLAVLSASMYDILEGVILRP